MTRFSRPFISINNVSRLSTMERSFLTFCLVTLTLLPGMSSGASCSGGYVQCAEGDNCIYTQNVCDGTQHCTDGSDEDQELCSFWSTDATSYCSRGKITCSSSCYNLWDGCRNSRCTSEIREGKMCKIVKAKALPAPYNGMKLDVETVDMLAKAVGSQISISECPMLYTRVGNYCVSFFTLAQVPWPEARQFCQSIHGDLLTIKDIQLYGGMLDYLWEKGLSTDFWLGGRFDMDLNNWCWLDDTPMPSNSPYWALRYSSSCKSRSPGGKCSNYIQLPEQQTEGYCAAITYESYFYISDEKCSLRKSPLCMIAINKLKKVKIA